ncbi:hypothetical protein DICPUDRAFT_78539 [Dictyostelium purpureum]|uniref:Uncharacterized protein n=1 Tax=Dictyostelium purpureum TaxID=5786 RepID=F0ZJV1_DICPU|nr:uncharacterized protein DICPUDRAFT_78539 [Dictyostelium purpureum]EGC35804.1 hypothetical protein DICPUDRAFT_78539 [Dictyostelium purpureum]|eukprot:XP_003287698.1 hypothetical protein DICPUDRAFT_78539 [Dictyostelium purpureum]
MYKYIFAILLLSTAAARSQALLCPVTTSPSYCPLYIVNADSIPSAAAVYPPSQIVNQVQHMNTFAASFGSALDLLAGVTDPIFNGSELISEVEQYAIGVRSAVNNGVNTWTSVLNTFFQMDVIGPTNKYRTAFTSITAIKTPFQPLFTNGVAFYQRVLASKIVSLVDTIDLSDYYLEGSCTIDEAREVLITNNRQILRPAYDFYLALDTVNQLNI